MPTNGQTKAADMDDNERDTERDTSEPNETALSKEVRTSVGQWATAAYAVHCNPAKDPSSPSWPILVKAYEEKARTLLQCLPELAEGRRYLVAMEIVRAAGSSAAMGAASTASELKRANKQIEHLAPSLESAQGQIRDLEKKLEQVVGEHERELARLKLGPTSNLEAHEEKTSRSLDWIKLLIVVGFSVLLAVVLVLLATVYSPAQIATQVQVTYDLGKIIESLLLGSGGLLAGAAYAVSTLRPVSEDASKRQ